MVWFKKCTLNQQISWHIPATQKTQGIVQQKHILKYKNPQKTLGQRKVDPLQQKYVEILFLTLTDYMQFCFSKESFHPSVLI